MEYYLGEDGKEHLSLYKRRLPYSRDDLRPKSEIIPLGGRRPRLRPGAYGAPELTICGLSGRPVNPAPGGDGLSWRYEE